MTAYGSAHVVLAALAGLFGLGHLALFVILRERLQLIISTVFFAFSLVDYTFATTSVWSTPTPAATLPALLLTLGSYALAVSALSMVPWVLYGVPFKGARLAFWVVLLLGLVERTAAALWDAAHGHVHTMDSLWSFAEFRSAAVSAVLVLAVMVEWMVEVVLAARRKEDPVLMSIIALGAGLGAATCVHSVLIVFGVLHQPLLLGLGPVFFLFMVSGYLGRQYVRAARRATGIGGYQILMPLGAGGMGETFIAVRQGVEGFSRQVVLKKMLGQSDPTDRERFLSEAKLAAALRHPNIVDVLDLGELDDGGLFIAMEFISGPTVSELAQAAQRAEQSLSPQVVAAIGVQLCRGLEHAHRAGVLHRDIKRANVMVSVDGMVKLIDFGLAQRPTAEPDAPMAGLSRLSGGLTERSRVIGTPGYLAPERLQGDPATVASDLFAVGVVLYELLAGHRPFESLAGEEDVQAVLSGRHRLLGEIRRDAPEGLVAAVERCLEVDPKKRPASAAELGGALLESTDTARVDLGQLVRTLVPAKASPPSSAASGASPGHAVRADAPTTPFRR